MKDTVWTDFTSTAFWEPLIVISETASPSMWLFEPLTTTDFVPAGISTCALDSLTVKTPEASDLPESFDVSDLPESVDESVLVSVRGLLEASGADEAAGAEESPPETFAVWGAAGQGHGGDGQGSRGGKEGLQGHGVSLSYVDQLVKLNQSTRRRG